MIRYHLIYPIAHACSSLAMWLDSFHDGKPRFYRLWHIGGMLEGYADECAHNARQ